MAETAYQHCQTKLSFPVKISPANDYQQNLYSLPKFSLIVFYESFS